MMIQPERMSKVTLVGAKSAMREVIEELHRQSQFHIVDYSKEEGEDLFDLGRPFLDNEEVSTLHVRLRTLMYYLSIKPGHMEKDITLEEARKRADELYPKVLELVERKGFHEKAIHLLSPKKQQASLKALNLELPGFPLYYIGYARRSIGEEVDSALRKAAYAEEKVEGIYALALFVDKGRKEKAEKLLQSADFIPIEVPYIREQYKIKGTPGLRHRKLGDSAERAQSELDRIKKQLSDLSKANRSMLVSAERMATIKNEIAEAPLRFATSENTFIIRGYVPTAKVRGMTERLMKSAKGKIDIQAEEVHEEAPVSLNHPKLVEPFRFFMDLYTLPRYGEIDPTFFMFLTFPIFFGFMLGDVGYGIITLGLFFFLKKKMPGARMILDALMIASLSTIVFGMVFGEAFGLEEIELGHETIHFPHLLSRSHQITDLLTLSVLIGIVHVMIGHIIGFVNIYRHHGLKHAVMEKAGWLLLTPLLIWLLGNLGVLSGQYGQIASLIVPPMIPLIAISAVAIVLIILGEGIRGALELPGILSNILSYARLMAVGLASVSLAVVVNDLSGELFHSGGPGIVIGIFVLVIGHIINIALGILSPFLHSLRLHYVEFFGKFFKGGGQRFKAFGQSR